MSPELLSGRTESTPAIDVWSLGILLYGLLLGSVPFRSSNKEELKKMIIEQPIKFPPDCKLTAPCKELIKRMLDKDPNKRITIAEIMNQSWIGKYKE
jgi:serine/threonine protein kinase